MEFPVSFEWSQLCNYVPGWQASPMTEVMREKDLTSLICVARMPL
jgi:hypothetical protein